EPLHRGLAREPTVRGPIEDPSAFAIAAYVAAWMWSRLEHEDVGSIRCRAQERREREPAHAPAYDDDHPASRSARSTRALSARTYVGRLPSPGALITRGASAST